MRREVIACLLIAAALWLWYETPPAAASHQPLTGCKVFPHVRSAPNLNRTPAQVSVIAMVNIGATIATVQLAAVHWDGLHRETFTQDLAAGEKAVIALTPGYRHSWLAGFDGWVEARLYGDARVVVETFDTATSVRTTLDYGQDCKVRTP